MTEAALMELLEMATNNAFTAFMMYLTVMFAYVVTAYFVGARLTLAQAILSSGLFLFGAFTSTAATVICLARAYGYQRAAHALPEATYRTSFWWSNETTDFWVYSLLLTCLLGAILALWFMWDVRRRDAARPQ